MLDDVIGKGEILTKAKIIQLMRQAEQDEKGNWYVLRPQDKYDIESGRPAQRVYFGMFSTLCEDFVEEHCTDSHSKEKNTEHYNRHFWNDDTFELYVMKDPEVITDPKDKLLKELAQVSMDISKSEEHTRTLLSIEEQVKTQLRELENNDEH